MKFNNLTSLFVSTFLVTTAASAMHGELSDALNGFNIPENPQAHMVKMKQKLSDKADRRGHIFEQVNRYFAPQTRKGDDHDRMLANAILDVLQKDWAHTEYQQNMYESYGEDGRPPKINSSMKGLPSKAGIHIAMVREADKLSEELKSLNALIDKRPEEKTQLLQTHKNNTTSLETLERETADLKKQGQAHLQKQQEYKAKIETEDEKIEVLKEKIAEIKRQLDENIREKNEALSPKQQNLNELVKAFEDLESEKGTLNEQLAALTLQKDLPVETEVSVESTQSVAEEEPDKKSQSESIERRLEAIESEMTSKKTDIDAFNLEIQQVENKYGETHQSLEAQKKEIEISLGESTLSLEQLKTNLVKEVEEPMDLVEKKLKENLEKTIQLQDEMAVTEKALSSFDGISEELREKSAQQKSQLMAVQDQADLYALMKYVKYLNFYLALPNDDFSAGHEDKLETLSYYDRPIIRQLVDRRADEVGKYNVATAVPREIGKYSKVASDYIANINYKRLINEIITLHVRNINFYNDGQGPFVENIEKNLKNALTTKKFDAIYEKDETRNNYSPQPISDDDWSQEIQILDTTRADRLFKQSALKWKSKLSSQPDSLIHRLGFVTALFHKDFDFQNITTLFSFRELHDSLPVDVLRAPDKIDWKFASVQLKTNFSQEWTNKESPIHDRITPILAFVNHKASKTLKKEQAKDGSVEKSFLKMISYMNMSYALTHDLKGNKVAPLHLIDPALEPYITPDSISVAQRLDYVMANKALKWADRVWEQGEEFIENLGLKAWFLDNYPFALNNKKINMDEQKILKSTRKKRAQ